MFNSIIMEILIVFWVLFYLLVPAGVVRLCRRVSFMSKIGAILSLYFIGIIVANLFIFPFDGVADALFPIQDAFTSITIPLAMPLILFACDFKHWPVKKALASLLIGIVSVVGIAVAGYFLFCGKSGSEEFNKITGMIIGVYTGGTPNLAAIKLMLGVDESTYLLMNSFDMVVSFIYLTFLMAVGIRFFRWILPFSSKESAKEDGKLVVPGKAVAQSEDELYQDIFTKKNFPSVLGALGLAALIVVIGLGLSFAISGEINMIILILTLTTLAIAASLLPAVRRMTKSYDVGMYLVLIFSLVVASMVDIRSINISEGLWILLYIIFAIFGSLTLQVIFARIFKIDADTTIITSVALINSPLFVPMMADCMKNRKVIISGITIGIIGYAIGNYLGVIIAGVLA